jgi:hypothetical protein
VIYHQAVNLRIAFGSKRLLSTPEIATPRNPHHSPPPQQQPCHQQRNNRHPAASAVEIQEVSDQPSPNWQLQLQHHRTTQAAEAKGEQW